MKRGKRGQIWVETVIYTLIGLAIIGILLAIIKPVIDEKKDELLLKQSRDMLSSIDASVEDVRYFGTGNSREVELTIKKGQLTIDGNNNIVQYYMRSKYMFSQLDSPVTSGKVVSLTVAKGKDYDVYLTLNYSSMNISYNRKNEIKTLTQAPNPYKLFITNYGKINPDDKINIDFS